MLASTLAERFRLTGDGSPREVSTLVDQFVGHHRIRVLRRYVRGAAELRRACFKDFSISHLSYGREVEVYAPEPGDYYHLQFGLSGFCHAVQGDKSTLVAPNHAGIINPNRDARLRYSEDCAKLILRIEREALNGYVSRRLGFILQRPILFDPEVNLSSASGQGVVRFMDYLLREIDDQRSRFVKPGACESLKDMLFDSLIMLLPNNYTDLLTQTEDGPGGSAVLKRAIECMTERFDQHITPQDLAQDANVSVRSLYAAFHKHAGVSPIAYLRSLRLRKARELLSSHRYEGMSVTDVAYAVGIEHLGRFARDYQRLFGEKPSETMRGRRGR